jgi:hypothetical protein
VGLEFVPFFKGSSAPSCASLLSASSPAGGRLEMAATRGIGRTSRVLPALFALHAATLPPSMLAAQQPQHTCQPTKFQIECSSDGTWSSNGTWAQCAPKQCRDVPTGEGNAALVLVAFRITRVCSRVFVGLPH